MPRGSFQVHRARGTKTFEFLRWPFEIPAKQCRPICPHWAGRPAVVSWKLRRPSLKFKFFSSPGFLQLNLMFRMAKCRGRIFLSFKIEVAKSVRDIISACTFTYLLHQHNLWLFSAWNSVLLL